MSKKNPCKLTSKDTIQVTSEGFIVNGTLKPSLKGCTIEEGARFVMLVKEEEPTPRPKASAPAPTPQVQTFSYSSPQAPQPNPVQLPAELQEVKELIDVYRATEGLGPWVAIAVVGFVLWRKINRQDQGCQHCSPRPQCSHHHHQPTLQVNVPQPQEATPQPQRAQDN